MILKRVLWPVCIISALTVTPLVIFVSPSTALYLKNQEDLGRQAEVMRPFIAMSLAVLSGGGLLFLLSRFRPFRLLLWVYIIAGPFFLVYSAAWHMHVGYLDRPAVVIVGLMAMLALSFTLYIRHGLRTAVQLFAALGMVLIVNEAYQFYFKYKPYQPPFQGPVPKAEQVRGRSDLPNIYFLVLDEYQSDVFGLTLTPEVKEQLKGFVFFKENTTVYGRTAMSMASIFSGRSYDIDTAQLDYEKKAYNTDASILYWLKKAGYVNYGYLYPIYTFNLGLFDYQMSFKENAGKSLEHNSSSFNKLWIYANLPGFLAERMIGREQVEQIEAQNMLPGSANVDSFISYKKFLADEKYLPATGRFTYVHLLIPHFPNIFRADGSYSDDLKLTGPLEQAKCATKLTVDLCKTLKGLGRFENSLIFVFGDHGARYDVTHDPIIQIGKRPDAPGEYPSTRYKIPWATARSRALLLMKPVGKGQVREFIVSDSETTLLDIAPTIFASLDLKTDIPFEGSSLLKQIGSHEKHKRLYHFYDKKGENEWTDQIARFTIENGRYRQPKIKQLKNNPLIPAAETKGLPNDAK